MKERFLHILCPGGFAVRCSLSIRIYNPPYNYPLCRIRIENPNTQTIGLQIRLNGKYREELYNRLNGKSKKEFKAELKKIKNELKEGRTFETDGTKKLNKCPK